MGWGCADHPSQRLSWIFFTFSFSLTNNFSIHLICIDSFYRLDSCALQNNSKYGFTFQISVNVVALENQFGSKTYLIWLEFPPTVRGITFLIKCTIICKCLQGLTANQNNLPIKIIPHNTRSERARQCWMVELNLLSLRDTDTVGPNSLPILK